VGGGALEALVLYGEPTLLLDEHSAVLLGNALRANTTLTSVAFKDLHLFSDAAAATVLLGALTAHPTVQKLDLSFNYGDEDLAPAALAAAGAALGDALPANTHLRVLVYGDNDITEAFERERLLPAVRANPWLEAKLE
jgi:hypothetical protein